MITTTTTYEITPVAEGLKAVDSVNIGFTAESSSGRIALESIRKRRKANLESLARKRLLKLPLEQIHQPDEDLDAPMRQMMAAKHYGIFEDLFGPPHYFLPVTPLHVFFSLEDEEADNVQPVFYGNHISASHAKSFSPSSIPIIPRLPHSLPCPPHSVQHHRSPPHPTPTSCVKPCWWTVYHLAVAAVLQADRYPYGLANGLSRPCTDSCACMLV
ncbi:unnamed protein product [Schistocephalus solidus]|uniref:Enhancer of polycomb-like protein n=1 Tax=Schistocephalus solidus TaxID=70667 RepID=A0A183TAM2_SCHSO|nr:unnamed protein product [Schistocephalus solidus]